jgi:hypothetical protein
MYNFACNSKTSKAIPLAVNGGLQGCEMLRIPYCLENRVSVDGVGAFHGIKGNSKRPNGKVVSLTRQPHSTLQNMHFSISGIYL